MSRMEPRRASVPKPESILLRTFAKMSKNYSYDQLPPILESQDKADATDTPYSSERTLRQQHSNSSLPGYSPLYERSNTDLSTRKSIDTLASSSSTGSNIEKLKKGWNRMRRKPAPGSFQGSVRRHPAAEVEPTRIKRGVWKDQLLIDRSLRGMAALTALFALGIFIIIVAHIQPFANRANMYTSSIGGKTQSCKDVTMTNTALLLLINAAATMILGMSNTYQQLVTSLTIGDLKNMLQKFGDSKVGTNSPFNINHKKEGKRKSWLAWLLLITTSLPVHFLANSLIGPSTILEPPAIIQYNETNYADMSYGRGSNYGAGPVAHIYETTSFVCWSAFRTGKAHFPKSSYALMIDESDYGGNSNRLGTAYSTMIIQYSTENCAGLVNSTSDTDMIEDELQYTKSSTYPLYFNGNCRMGNEVRCSLYDMTPAKCRLNVRMNAAFVLLASLTIKATYMIVVNLLARGKLKTHCLTFGDVLVASSSDPELRVQGECMVNAGDSVRRVSTHTCHKHCKSREETKTGDEIGHCQTCKKWNSHNKLSNLPQPSIATKFKKSLIANLGNTALTQMCLLMLCSFILLGASLFLAVAVGTAYTSKQEVCERFERENKGYSSSSRLSSYCKMSSTETLDSISGGWGGFNHSLALASLPPDKLSNEMISFAISNGAQFIYSLLYLMMIYNITLCSQEHSWGRLEHERKRLRCTIVRGESFSQDYLLQLPRKILFPIMGYSILCHWMLGEALQTQEAVWLEDKNGRHVEHSKYAITFAAYPVWAATFLIMLMTGVCWWAYTYKREGFIPQMFGSIRTLCAATTSLDDFPTTGVQWSDLGMNRNFRHAGLSAEMAGKIVPNELYAGLDSEDEGEEEPGFVHEEEILIRRSRV